MNSFFDGDQPSSLLDRLHNGCQVKWDEGTRIDDFTGNPLLFEFLRGFHSNTNHTLNGNKRHVCPGTNDSRLAEGYDVFAVWNLAFFRVLGLVFKENNRIVIPDGTLKQPQNIRRVGRHGNFKPWRLHEPRFTAL